uniref:Odorant binding protein 23 n=1 Tax=Heliconius charithonia TaxID=33434 RepID=A0AA49EZW8_HELCH|nr:odorant binding protein 23 [Heliconius charithonia]
MRVLWCLFLVTLATVYAGNVKVEYVDIPNEYIPAIEKASSECVKKLNLEEEQITLQRFLNWELSDSPNTHKYIYCLGHDSGYFAEDGTILKDKVLAIMGKYRDRVDGVIDECNKVKYDNKHEEVYRKEVCFRDLSGLYFRL